MAVCCCSLAGTAACQHCPQNPFATDVWTNNTVTVDHIDATPFGNGLDVCPVCGKPSTIGKPQTNADRIRSMTDEELAKTFYTGCENRAYNDACLVTQELIARGDLAISDAEQDEICLKCWLDWLKSPEVDDG